MIVSMILIARTPQKAVIHVVIVDELTRDRAPVVDCSREGAAGGDCARARTIEDREHAVEIAQKAMRHIVIVEKESCDVPLRVDCEADGALASACARARSIERSDGAVAIAQEAMSHIVIVKVGSR